MSEETTAVTTTAIAKIDNGKPALYNPAAFDQVWRAAKMFSASDLVPVAYKGKPENCFIAIEMADRMGISPFAMLQSLVIIQGKPSMEAKLIIALVNDSGIFADPLEYEIVGDDPHAQSYKVRCFATMKKSGKLCQGPWITYQMVKGEGWLDKGGSKWKTMPSIMFMYRAASFFAKVYCPNITMGMQTREEMEDVKMVNITPERITLERQEAPQLLPPAEIKPAFSDVAPPLVAPLTETIQGEVIDIETGEIVEPEPTKPVRTRRTKEQIEADKAVETVVESDATEPEPVAMVEESAREEPPHPVAAPTADDDVEGDLF